MAKSKVKKGESFFLSDLLEKSHQPFTILFPDGRLKLFNPAFARLVGYSFQELSSIDWLKDLTPQEWIDDELTRLKELSQTGEPIRYEKEYMRKDGTRVPVELLVQKVKDDQGQQEYYFTSINDISKRKEIEHALLESEECFRRIYEEGPVGIAMIGSDFRFISANEVFCKMIGYTEEELLLLTFKNITHPEHFIQDFEAVKKLLYGIIPVYRTQKRYIRKDKEVIWGSVTITAIREPNGNFLYFLALISDITEHRTTEDSLQKR